MVFTNTRQYYNILHFSRWISIENWSSVDTGWPVVINDFLSEKWVFNCSFVCIISFMKALQRPRWISWHDCFHNLVSRWDFACRNSCKRQWRILIFYSIIDSSCEIRSCQQIKWDGIKRSSLRLDECVILHVTWITHRRIVFAHP